MGMEALGRLFNVVPTAIGKSISLKGAAGVTFVVYGANEVVTLKSQPSSGGTATNLAVITRYQQSTAADGSAGWAEEAQAAAATVTPPSGGAIAFYVDAADLPAGAEYVEVVKTTSALAIAIIHDLFQPSDPAYLVAPNA